MATLNVPDAVYRQLEARAAALGTTVEALAIPALVVSAVGPPAAPRLEVEWRERFDALVAQARARADRYPPGFRADVSREAMYEGRGE